jgi:hypothetical protein
LDDLNACRLTENYRKTGFSLRQNANYIL